MDSNFAMKYILRFPNFITSEESKNLSNWILENKHKKFFKDANMLGKRITTRYSLHKDFEYPETVKCIRKKIVNLLSLHEEESAGIYPPFKNGAVASCAFPGDTCYEHIDQVWHDGFNTLHCNVITQSPESGGDLILNGVVEPMREKELICYLVSKSPHKTNMVEGVKERLMWIFGFCITNKAWNNITQKYEPN
jgi:hypothetical protein